MIVELCSGRKSKTDMLYLFRQEVGMALVRL
jgi:hypothetical protein